MFPLAPSPILMFPILSDNGLNLTSKMPSESISPKVYVAEAPKFVKNTMY